MKREEEEAKETFNYNIDFFGNAQNISHYMCVFKYVEQ